MQMQTPIFPDEPAPPPQAATPEMAARLAVNRLGKLTRAQRRRALLIGLGALALALCPLALLVQMVGTLLLTDLPVPTLGSVLFTAVGVFFALLMLALFGANAHTFLGEALMRRPVRVARGPLELRVSEGHRPELPFSYIVGSYSFAPYVAPADLPMRVGAPYLVYYGARSRLLLSMAALDAPDAEEWLPRFGPDYGRSPSSHSTSAGGHNGNVT